MYNNINVNHGGWKSEKSENSQNMQMIERRGKYKSLFTGFQNNSGNIYDK